MEYPTNCDELTRKAANPDSMGGHGQPTGRPMEKPQYNDSNHPQGGSSKASMPSKRLDSNPGSSDPGY